MAKQTTYKASISLIVNYADDTLPLEEEYCLYHTLAKPAASPMGLSS